MVLVKLHVKFTTVPTGLTIVSVGVNLNTVNDDGNLVGSNKLKLLAEIKYKFCRHVLSGIVYFFVL